VAGSKCDRRNLLEKTWPDIDEFPKFEGVCSLSSRVLNNVIKNDWLIARLLLFNHTVFTLTRV
jgi:hypothetical protein